MALVILVNTMLPILTALLEAIKDRNLLLGIHTFRKHVTRPVGAAFLPSQSPQQGEPTRAP